MKKSNSLLSYFVFLLIFLIPASVFSSSDRPFNNSSNWGGTGLMEIPNARILEDGVVRIGGTYASPYRWLTGGMGILPGLEFSGRLTAITNIPALTPEYGSNKDKAFDLKYQILAETKQMPAIAVGINDFWGTGLFPSEYIVMSRQIFPFDITLGVGSKRFSGGSAKFINDDYSVFGGFELKLSDRFMFMAEYNPIKYEVDKPSARGVPEGAKYPVNVGLRARLITGIDIGLSFQRGNTIGLMFHLHNLLGESVLPFRPDPAPLVAIDRRSFDKRDQREMAEDIHQAILKAGFSDVTVYTDGRDLIAEFENTKYLSNQKAVGRVLRILLFHSPEDTDRIIAVLKKSNMPILKISVKPDHMEKFIFREISDEVFLNKLIDLQVVANPLESQKDSYISVTEEKEIIDYSLDPLLNIYWNDPSGFFKFRSGIAGNLTVDLWKGASLNTRMVLPIYSNIESPISDDLPSDVVRSDLHRYMRNDFSVDRLLFNQTLRISERIFGRVSMGYFERMYAGVGGEALYFPGEGRMAFGIEGDWVRKRAPGKALELMDVDRHSVLANFYYYYSPLEITFHAQYGRFLAGDMGWMFDFNRRYPTGVKLGVYASFTDTDDVPHSFNKGYNHKGIYLSIPIRTFLTHDSPRTLNYGLSPWTRDVAQAVPHYGDLFDLAGEFMPARFRVRQEEMRE